MIYDPEFVKGLNLSIMEYINTIQEWYLAVLPNLKLISVIISSFLLICIIYILIKFNYVSQRTDFLTDTARASSNYSRKRVARGWKRILKLMRSKKVDDWKNALIEADNILGEVLRLADYQGVSLDEQLDNISVEQLSVIDNLRNSHQLTKRIKQDEDFDFDKETIEENLFNYSRAFRELRLF